ncbi:Photosystem I P700 chlorophyll a apoprotein A1 [Platanthera guangdongensis]|uniref:Photosystem I P700 chlorophyll a apoprotein A1 n=1 Tax=Platanthera guangdongensis TaxID=2320717 RepID=A0ABR2LE83_9ASPA
MACSIIYEPSYDRHFNYCCCSPCVLHAPNPYLAIDYGTQLSLFTHHMWISGFLIVGAFAHAAIFMVRDYDPTTRYNDLLDHVLKDSDAIISHMN